MINRIKNSILTKMAAKKKDDQGKKVDSKKKSSKDKTMIEELEKQLNESKDKYLRLFAEFENYKKRTMKEKLDLMKTAAQDTLNSILPTLDDFDRAKISADDESSPEEFSEGVRLVYDKLYATLLARGLKKMNSTGETFDPELHEAITEIPAPSEDMKGKVIDTVQTGYYLQDKIIRHAKVVVGK
jgi:molecular chaperone GrpE